MKINLITILILLAVFQVTNSQVSQEFSLEGGLYCPYRGTFYFELIPEPLKSTRVNFTFEVKDSSIAKPQHLEKDWNILLNVYLDKILSDSVFFWPGPHVAGDQFSGSFEVMFIKSGERKIIFKHDIFGRRRPHIRRERSFTNEKELEPLRPAYLEILCCLDYQGNLMYLGKNENKVACDSKTSTFFTEDSIFLSAKNTDGVDFKNLMFDYEVIISPTLKIGDTSEVKLLLKATDDYPNGLNLDLESRAYELVSIPSWTSGPISKEEEIELSFGICPLPVRTKWRLNFEFEKKNLIGDRRSRPRDRKERQQILISAMFDDDGNLQIINNGTLGNTSLLISTTYEPMIAKKHLKRIRITESKDSKKE